MVTGCRSSHQLHAREGVADSSRRPASGPAHVVDLQRHIGEWADRIEKLLAWHYIRLDEQYDILLVQLAAREDGKAHVYPAVPSAG
jgi:hypothetical protein